MINILNVFNRNSILLVVFLLLIAYLLLNTGIISDDFDAMARVKGQAFKDVLMPAGSLYFVETPVEHFTHFIWYRFFQLENQNVENIMKILYIMLSFYLISNFFQLYLSSQDAFLASFLFIFFPSHDSTVYCFMNQYLTLCFAFYLYAYYLAAKNKLALALIFAFIASFISYGSSVLAISLFFLFILRKEIKKGFILLIPNVIYALYYIYLTKIACIGLDKMAGGLTAGLVAKQFLFQIATFADAVIGPSLWLKVYYSFSQLSASSIAIGLVLVVFFWKIYKPDAVKYDRKLIFSLIILMFGSFLMFAVTGRYPQLAFNIGNRTTIFSSLLVAYFIILSLFHHKLRVVVFALLVFSILGISDHWKSWNVHQRKVMVNIKNNPVLRSYRDKKTIYVSGNQYSKYGPISHIEFISEGWVVGPVFTLLLGRGIEAAPLNKRHRYENGYLIDTKYNTKTKEAGCINIYDSEKDLFFELEVGKINSYINSLPEDTRHWVQMLKVKFLKDLAVRLQPSLRYAL